MYVFTMILILILLLVVSLAIVPVKVVFAANSERLPDFYIKFSWLNPFITGNIVSCDEGPILSVNLLSKEIIRKKLKKSKDTVHVNKLHIIRSFKPNGVKIKTSYGFQDISITGMMCAAINILSEFMHLDSVYNNPDFIAEYDYFELDGILEMNVLSSLIAWLKLRNNHDTAEILHPAK